MRLNMWNELPIRKHLRLKGYDYSKNGAYFITICVKGRHEILGVVGAALAPPADSHAESPKIHLTEYGKTVKTHIESLQNHYNDVFVDKYVIMPNHVHMIVVTDAGGASAAPTLGNLVRGFKAGISRECGFTLWQRSFYDHVIRNEEDYLRVCQYIDENPDKWAEDQYFTRD